MVRDATDVTPLCLYRQRRKPGMHIQQNRWPEWTFRLPNDFPASVGLSRIEVPKRNKIDALQLCQPERDEPVYENLISHNK